MYCNVCKLRSVSVLSLVMQMELHALSWLDEGRSTNPEALPDEIRGGTLGANS